MRRLLIATVAVGIAAGAAAPAFAQPNIPVTVTGHGNGGICVTVSDQEPQCIDFGKP